jgi:hypothetical protein
MTIAKFSLATATFLGLAGLASISVAATVTTFPGTGCVEANDATPEILYLNGIAVNNHPTENAVLECPIIRLSSDVVGPMSSLNVRVDDSHPNENVRCRVHSCNESGTNCSVSSTASSAGIGSQSMSMGSVSTFTYGYAYLSCDVPDSDDGDRSGVLSYRVLD